LFPTLRKKYLIAKDSAEFVFAPQHRFAYEPGQYMEFTLPHDNPDTRGSRRWFTLSSSPTEPDVKIGVRFYRDGSSYKSALTDIEPGDQIVAAQLAGDFTMPKDINKKLLFIAGGIGITPYRSMIKYLIDKKQYRDVVLLYSARSPEYIAYTDFFDEAVKKIKLKVGYVIDGNQAGRLKNGINGRLNAKLVSAKVPDFKERLIYISGPLKMTEEIKEDLIAVGVKHANIKVDFFSGYA
jgi:ferredoxin-NADP reductase